jgi:DNA-directed RNA polymerase beta subunit
MEKPKLRSFFDPAELNTQMRQNILEGYQKKINEIETSDFKLQLKNLAFSDKKISTEDQKNAVLNKKDVSIPLKGTVDLIDKRIDKVVESKDVTLLHVPVFTQRSTVIYNGSEYQPIHQQRLLPGVYSRIKQSGEPEAFFNPSPKTGMALRLLLIPETQLFIFMIQSTQIKAYGILKAIGISDSELERYWGTEILTANRKAYTGDEIDKLYAKLYT